MSDKENDTTLSLVASFNITNDDTEELKEDSGLFRLGELPEDEVKGDDYLQLTISNDEGPEENGDLEKSLEEAEEEVASGGVAHKPLDEEKEDKNNPTFPLKITTKENDTHDCGENNTEHQSVNEAVEKPMNVKYKNAASGDLKTKPDQFRTRRESNFLWVSNISRQIKAADLKKFFAKIGKVSTAKILTNGRHYFGYITMESEELAAKCMKQLNNSLFEGRKIVISKDRPDLRETKTPIRTSVKTEKHIKNHANSDVKAQTIEPKVDVEEKIYKTQNGDAVTELKSIIADLRKKYDIANSDIRRYRQKLLQYERRHDGMRKKYDSLQREFKQLDNKVRTERRKLNQDKEQFEKTKKIENGRLQADKEIISKELIEVRKLRQRLKEKLEELKIQSRKVAKRRSRSPQIMHKQAPLVQSSVSANAGGYRSDERIDRKRRREEVPRGHTPPPPPKLNENRPKKNLESGRSYFGGVGEKRPQVEYEYRHKSSFGLQQDSSRTPWSVDYVKDPRRVISTSGAPSYSMEGRYGDGFQSQSSSFGGVPRNFYMPQYGKQYDHY